MVIIIIHDSMNIGHIHAQPIIISVASYSTINRRMCLVCVVCVCVVMTVQVCERCCTPGPAHGRTHWRATEQKVNQHCCETAV